MGSTFGALRPGAQVTRRGMRPSTRRRISWAGHDVGKGTRIIVFISTMRAATLISRRRNVSNCATRHIERLGIDARRPHMIQYAPACKNSRNWLAVAFVHEVRSAARCVFQDLM